MSSNLLYEEITYRIRAAIFSVYNTLGFGHKEHVYQHALAVEFQRQNIKFIEEQPLDVFYNGQKVGIYRPDFIIEDKIIAEIKALPFIGGNPERQLIYYLKGTNFKLGFLVNFGSTKLDIRRKIWSGYPRKSAIDPRQSL
jgi:GxxExxY protein